MNIQVPLTDRLKDFVEAEIAAGGHASASAYVLSLLKAARKRRPWAKVEALVLEGLNSGEPVEVTPEFWKGLRREVRERAAKARRRPAHG